MINVDVIESSAELTQRQNDRYTLRARGQQNITRLLLNQQQAVHLVNLYLSVHTRKDSDRLRQRLTIMFSA